MYNSNITHIPSDNVTDFSFINDKAENIVTASGDIIQQDHGFNVYDAVYMDDDGLYKKAVADGIWDGDIAGIVSAVKGSDVFTLVQSGSTGTSAGCQYGNEDSSVLYLSDTVPGQLVHYQSVSNTHYMPVANYTHKNGLIINIQQPTSGARLEPYGEYDDGFETYTMDEINDMISVLIGSVSAI